MLKFSFLNLFILELKEQIVKEETANVSILLEQENLIYEKKKTPALSVSEFQDSHYDNVMVEFLRERQKLRNTRKIYITLPEKVVPMRDVLVSLKYKYFKSLAFGVKLNSLCFDTSIEIDSTLIIDDFYEEIKKENFHWKFWPQILGTCFSNFLFFF